MKSIYNLIFIITFSLAIPACNPHKSNSQLIDERIEADLKTTMESDTLLGQHVKNKPDNYLLSDAAHSSISFTSGHWEIVDLIGWFDRFNVIMYTDSADFSDALIFAEADIRSIRMPNIKMEESVKNAPYVDTQEFPFASFESTSFTKRDSNNYELVGIMELNGYKNECSFDVIFNGYAYPGEKSICGFSVKGIINRHDFHFGGEGTLHSGKKLHDDLIEINMSLRME